jgi:dGTPase
MADDIAYINHDIDDGLRAELFTVKDLRDAPLVGAQVADILARFGDLELSRLVGEIVRRLMSALIVDLLQETRVRLAQASPASAHEIRAQNRAMVAFSDGMAPKVKALKNFMFARMYRHPHVMGSMSRAQAVIAELFDAFNGDPAKLPPDWAKACGASGEASTVSVVRDYIAGMTDNFALQEYARVFHKEIAL